MQSKTINRLLSPFEQFVRGESAGGLALIAASLVVFGWANSSPQTTELTWVNGWLVNSAFLAGLKIKREVLVGEFSAQRAVMLTVVVVLGLLGRRASPGAG